MQGLSVLDAPHGSSQVDAAEDGRRRDRATAQRLRDALGSAGRLPERLDLEGRKCLLVASAGGHVAQMDWLVRHTQLHPESLWMTFRTPQTEGLMAGRRVVWLDYVPPRGYRQLEPAAKRIAWQLTRERFDVALSTGASIALPALATHALLGRRAVYLESISRVEGPSTTGQLASCLPGVELYTQHRGWEGGRWTWAGSVLDGLEFADRPKHGVRSVFVTLGTIKPYRFDRLVDRLLEVLPDDVSVTWQLGATTRKDLPGTVFAHVSAAEAADLIATSDLVVSHAGVATALQLASAGTECVLVPRRAAHGEHVDDHQAQIARLFADAGLARVVEADALTSADFSAGLRDAGLVASASGQRCHR